MKFQMFSLAIAINLLYLLMLSSAQNRIPEMELNWSHKSIETVFTFHKVQRIRDSLQFEIEAQNKHSSDYACFYVSSSEKSPHIDDNSGKDYPGITTIMINNNSNNKLAINQIKIFTISIPAPSKDVSQINLHLGLYVEGAHQRDDCKKPVQNADYNFHQLNWDVSSLR